MSNRLIAHLAHVEVLTPKPDESLAFYRDVIGLEESGRGGQSVFLRGWAEWAHHSVQLTESPLPGVVTSGGAPGAPTTSTPPSRRSTPPARARAGLTTASVTVVPPATVGPAASCTSCSTTTSATSRPPGWSRRSRTAPSATSRAGSTRA